MVLVFLCSITMTIKYNLIQTPSQHSLLIAEFDNSLVMCVYLMGDKTFKKLKDIAKELKQDIEEGESPLLHKVANQLNEYFRGERKNFDLPINPQGTDFQKKVWKALIQIPHGATTSYKEIASAIGAPKSCRAVGNAIGKNPIGIIIPCHRVKHADGSLGGFAWGTDIKLSLLALEASQRKEN